MARTVSLGYPALAATGRAGDDARAYQKIRSYIDLVQGEGAQLRLGGGPAARRRAAASTSSNDASSPASQQEADRSRGSVRAGALRDQVCKD